MNQRATILHLADTGTPGEWTPAAFFLHFPREYHQGKAAVDKHIEYFRATGNDIMKVQYESRYPARPELKNPADWSKIPCYGDDFYEAPWQVVEGVCKALKSEAVVVVTLYSAYMFASQLVGWDLLDAHMEEDPHAVGAGLEIITRSMITFIRGCLKRGADGFYASSQGGEDGRFSNSQIFENYIKPFEDRIWDEIDSTARLNILHVCDYEMPYTDISRFASYPGQIVSAPLHLTGGQISGSDVARMFGRPFLGGMERLEAISEGSPEQVAEVATQAIENGTEAMILGADCTLAANAPWANISAATAVAHSSGKTGAP